MQPQDLAEAKEENFAGAEEVPPHNNPPLYAQHSTMLNTSVQVEKILDQRESKTDEGKSESEIRWKGHGPEQDTWEPEESLYCVDLVHDYWEQRRVLFDGDLVPHSEDDESDDGEPEVAGHFVEVLPASGRV